MAPATLIETETKTETKVHSIPVKGGVADYKEAFNYGPKSYRKDIELEGTDKSAPARYPNYLPVWDAEKKYPPLEPFEHKEHGKDADASFANLLKEGSKVVDLTANIGAEVHGVQLSKLDAKGKDELALFVAQKKVVGKSNPAQVRVQKIQQSTEADDPLHFCSLSRPGLCRPAHSGGSRLWRILRASPYSPNVWCSRWLPTSALGA
jgi:hypothetical protein